MLSMTTDYANVSTGCPEPYLRRIAELHDNDGTGDQHRLPFDGTVDWPRLARLIAASPYRKPISLESNMGSYPKGADEMEHLRKALDAGTRLTQMIPSEDARGAWRALPSHP